MKQKKAGRRKVGKREEQDEAGRSREKKGR